MNISAVITASVFLLISIAALVFLFVGNTPFARGTYRKFYRASCGVYISGALLVLILTIVMQGLPVIFVVISDVTIMFVFAFTVGLIYFMTRSIVEAADKAGKKNEPESEERNESKESKDTNGTQ